MAEVLKISVSLAGFDCKPPSYSVRNHVCFGYYCGCLYNRLEIKPGKWGLGFTNQSLNSKLVKQTIRTHNPLGLPLKVATNESVLVYEEEEEEYNKFIQRKKQKFDLNNLGQNLPPWGNAVIQQDLECESQTVNGATNDSRMLSTRLLILSRSNKVKNALELYELMKHKGLQPSKHSCNSLISCLIRNKMLEDALRVFEFMKIKGTITSHSCSLILKAIGSTHDCDAALDMFTELELLKHKELDVIVYNTMISLCSRFNRSNEAEGLWGKMKENGYVGTRITYSLLVTLFVRSGLNELALDAYNEMVQNRFSPGDDIMHAVIGASTKEGRWDLALDVFRAMLDSNLKPNITSCNALINSLGKAGKIKLGFDVYDIMKSLGHKPDSYTWNALLSGLYRANRHVDVLELFEGITKEESCQLNVHLFNTALMSCGKLRLWDEALKLLWLMESLKMSVSTTSYNLVISACEIARKPKVALQVYEHMVHQECACDTFTYLSLIKSCIWGSLWVEVEEILDHDPPNVSLYNAAIQGMCLRGEIESAKRLYTKMRALNLTPDNKTRSFMLQNLRKYPARRKRLSYRRRG